MSNVTFISVRPNLPVADIERAVAFYCDVVGLEVRMRSPEYGLAHLGSGAMEIALLQRKDNPVTVYVNVTGVDALHERIARGGGTVAVPLTDEPWGLRDFVLEDPDGNRLAFGERIEG